MRYKVKKKVIVHLGEIDIDEEENIKGVLTAIKEECAEFSLKIKKHIGGDIVIQNMEKARVLSIGDKVNMLVWHNGHKLRLNDLDFDDIHEIEVFEDLGRKIRHKNDFSELEFIDLG